MFYFRLKELDRELKGSLLRHGDKIKNLNHPSSGLLVKLYENSGETSGVAIGNEYIVGQKLFDLSPCNLKVEQYGNRWISNLEKGKEYIFFMGKERDENLNEVRFLETYPAGKEVERGTFKLCSGYMPELFVRITGHKKDPFRNLETEAEVYRLGASALSANLSSRKTLAMSPLEKTEINF